MNLCERLLMLVIVALTVCRSASAAPVEPGQTIGLEHPDDSSVPYVPPGGDLLATDTRDLPLTYAHPLGWEILDEEPERGGVTSVRLTSEVRREPTTGTLSFLYLLEPLVEQLRGAEGTVVQVSSFSAFSTDVTAETFPAGVEVLRSSDGQTITIDAGGRGIDYPRPFAVTTDATDFDSNGTLTLTLQDEFAVIDPSDGNTTIDQAFATVTIGGVFQPASAAAPIPLTPGVWPGVAGLIAAVMGIRRMQIS